MDDYINEFERNLNRVKAHKIVFPDQFHAYRLLENANLEQSKNELIRTTITELTYKEMKAQLRKLEDVAIESCNTDSSVSVKVESDEVYFSRSSGNESRGRGSGRTRGGFRGSRGGGRGGFNSFYRQRTCFNCNSPEHVVRDCPNRNKTTT